VCGFDTSTIVADREVEIVDSLIEAEGREIEIARSEAAETGWGMTIGDTCAETGRR
jgi:hypothetical protein